ncbi:hypothetical protein LCGC14_0749270 [marine sediment metagenome]|uniref:Uncharacterized protein n=1 Tax=marine sediment metagenome TaxID=412755 RepID=A0A0F9QPD7_9ZZZZ
MESYTPRDINYDFPCVQWIWANILSLSGGEWPESSPSGYVDQPGLRSQGSSRANFENACLVAAEVEIRAKRCGLDGFLPAEKYRKGLSEEQIAKERHLTVDDVYRRINRVLGYSASGKAPRWRKTRWKRAQTYKQWCDSKGYRRKLIKANLPTYGRKT